MCKKEQRKDKEIHCLIKNKPIEDLKIEFFFLVLASLITYFLREKKQIKNL